MSEAGLNTFRIILHSPFCVFQIDRKKTSDNRNNIHYKTKVELSPWSQKRPPQPSSHIHSQGSEQVPCWQPGYLVQVSQSSPTQPGLQLKR